MPTLQGYLNAKNNGNPYRPQRELPGMGGVYNARNLGVYGYAGLNPMILIDPDGSELAAFQAKGLTTDDPNLKTRTYYADTKVADKMGDFAAAAYKMFGVTVNNTFRIEDSSQIKTTNTRAKGLSRHQGGFAIDLNSVGRLTPKQLEKLNALAAKHGFYPLDDQGSDLPHFSADPTDHGYKSLKEAVDVNRKDYLKKTQPKPTQYPLGDYVPLNEDVA
ncbi:MAG: hypothetical protein GWO38_26870 [Phycisphaerae bacterium]|nr:hypothetical protein [Phycisphaerae bacterium]NIX00927.1 hypothetical protein [Phycisphaerae bacterium]NIX31152.1 hypothetical protein [Phycisphaerae bacterium]